jgi:hypothetical protein
MKTLKFRAWHKTKKKMFEVKCIEFGSCIWSKDGNWFVPISEVEIMQFTGLLDRHGKEIYEGDIITNLYGDIGVVIWKERITSFVCSLNLVSFNSVNWDKCVIIGNIHDNQKLIYDQKAEVKHD